MLYDVGWAGGADGAGAEAVFWRAKLARASRIDWLFCAGGAGALAAAAFPCRDAIRFGGGLPGGVVETSAKRRRLGIATRLWGYNYGKAWLTYLVVRCVIFL